MTVLDASTFDFAFHQLDLHLFIDQSALSLDYLSGVRDAYI